MGHLGIRSKGCSVSRARFLVETGTLERQSHARLSGSELHHLRARRLRVGSELVLFDGSGCERVGMIEEVDHRHALIRLMSTSLPRRDSTLHLVLAQALLKPDRLDWLIEKASELGVAEIVVFESAHSVSHGARARPERWRRVAESAAKQSQRRAVATISGPVEFGDVLSRCDENVRLFFWEQGPRAALAEIGGRVRNTSSVLAVVGPEGGFARAEVDMAVASGFHLVGLTDRILRAETAAITAVVLCQYLWGGVGRIPAE